MANVNGRLPQPFPTQTRGVIASITVPETPPPSRPTRASLRHREPKSDAKDTQSSSETMKLEEARKRLFSTPKKTCFSADDAMKAILEIQGKAQKKEKEKEDKIESDLAEQPEAAKAAKAARNARDEVYAKLQEAAWATETFVENTRSQDSLQQLLQQQPELEREYVKWAGKCLQARVKAYGDLGYSLDGFDNKENTAKGAPNLRGEASLGVAVNAFAAGAKSALRSPVRAVAVKLMESKLKVGYDLANASAGATSISAQIGADIVVPAIKNRAKIANVASLKPVDVKVLFPDPPPFTLHIVTNKAGKQAKYYLKPYKTGKHLHRDRQSFKVENKTEAALLEEVESRRKTYKDFQDTLSGKAYGILLKPLLAGILGATRRGVLSEDALQNLSAMFVGTSLAASAGASAATEAALGFLQASPGLSGTDIDNLYGGTHRVNGFVLDRKDKSQPAAKWGDACSLSLPSFIGDLVREMAAITKLAWVPDFGPCMPGSSSTNPCKKGVLAFLGGRTTLVSWGYNTLANVMAASVGDGVGVFIAPILREGGSVEPLAGESLKSGAFVLGQFAASMGNELTWSYLSNERALGALGTPTTEELKTNRTLDMQDKIRRLTDQIDKLEEMLAEKTQLQPMDYFVKLQEEMKSTEAVLKEIKHHHRWIKHPLAKRIEKEKEDRNIDNSLGFIKVDLTDSKEVHPDKFSTHLRGVDTYLKDIKGFQASELADFNTDLELKEMDMAGTGAAEVTKPGVLVEFGAAQDEEAKEEIGEEVTITFERAHESPALFKA
jgi:hypothetical protein